MKLFALILLFCEGALAQSVSNLVTTNIFFAPHVNWEMATEQIGRAVTNASATCTYNPNAANLGTNSAVWTWPINLSCLGIGDDGYQFTLMSSNKVLLSSDFVPTAGINILWNDTNGVPFAAQITNVIAVTGNMEVGILNSNAPATIVLPRLLIWPFWTNWIQNVAGYPKLGGLPVFWPHKNAGQIENATLTFNSSGDDVGINLTSGLKCSGSFPTGGDSNSPVFAALAMQPILLYVMSHGITTGSGTFFGSSNCITAYLNTVGSTADLTVPNYNSYPLWYQ